MDSARLLVVARYLAAAVAVAIVTGAATPVADVLGLEAIVMLYLLAIILVAFKLYRGPAFFAAALSVAAFDFFFVPPAYTFAVKDPRHLLTFAVMFAVGLAISSLTFKVQSQGAAAREREVATALERARVVADVEAARLQARTEELRSALLSTVSHDLRTPLATITGAATRLRDAPEGTLTASERVPLVESICSEAERLERLLVDLLAMTRLESGGLNVRREWIPVEEVVGSALSRLESALADRPVVVRVPEDASLVAVDPVLFSQVLVNLLENAMKYTPARSPLEIRASVGAAAFDVEISDRGPGVPPGAEKRIFEKFVRGEHPGVGGVGLGLAICRGIVEAHGGTITARARDGGGATFAIHVPQDVAPKDLPPELAPVSARSS